MNSVTDNLENYSFGYCNIYIFLKKISCECYEYLNMQNQKLGTDNHILTKMETISGL